MSAHSSGLPCFAAHGLSIPEAQSGPGLEFSTVAIVGGGFSGTMAAVQLLRAATESKTPCAIVLFEKEPARLARGVAYSTTCQEHLLNVPAARMSAWPDRPDDFLAWAQQRDPTVGPASFLPRQLYGDYLSETLKQAVDRAGSGLSINEPEALAENADSAINSHPRESASASGSHEFGVLTGQAGGVVQFRIARQAVTNATRTGNGRWRVGDGIGPPLVVDTIVLATGHRPPADPLASVWRGSRTRYISQPWREDALPQIAADDDILILGSGLSAVDWVLALSSQPGTGRFTLVSRNGLLPQPHRPGIIGRDPAPALAAWLQTASGQRLNAVRRGVRELVLEGEAQGQDWRGVMDGLRAHTSRIWQALTSREKARFLARLRPFWEVHRHRMATAVAARIGSLRTEGRLQVIAGHCCLAVGSETAARLELRERRSGQQVQLRSGWVVNCTGPAAFEALTEDPLFLELSAQGHVVRDEAGLGIETDEAGNAIDSHGCPDSTLKVIGTLRKPLLWESTAVPELREQAARIAAGVVAGIKSAKEC